MVVMPSKIEANVKLLTFLKKVDEEPSFSLETFDERLIFQKKIYLLQSYGLDLGFKFGSYIRGPYSSSLTRNGFDLLEKIDTIKMDSILKIEIKNTEKKQINYLKNLLKELPENKSYWLELISSLHFLLNRAYPKIDTWMEAKKRLHLWKPKRFKKEDIKQAKKLMKKHNLISI